MEVWLVIGLLALAMILLAIRIILQKNGRFSSQHVAENPLMKKNKIHCVNSQDREARKPNPNRIDTKKL